ncbi:MAG: hypothetical protein IT424_09930 [Pirellulales bacterium]|nr:hypothetical protein [Pirellulales bacterium]
MSRRSLATSAALRPAAAILLSGALVAAAARPCSAQRTPHVDGPADRDFRTLLRDAGITAADMASLASLDERLTGDEAALLARIVFRLEQLDRGQLALEDQNAPGVHAQLAPLDQRPVGSLLELSGQVTSVAPLSSPAPSGDRPTAANYYACRVALPADKHLLVVAASIPRAWQTTADEQLPAPVSFRAVLLRPASADDQSPPLALTHRFQWYPQDHAPSGVLWLAAQGYDAALLDDVQQGRPLARTDEGREAAAFYQALARLAAARPMELTSLARHAVRDAAQAWAHRAADATARLAELAGSRPAADPDEPGRESQFAALRRQQNIAQHVAAQAKRGLSSVWPMFLDAERSVGELFLVEGIARRAVRIVVEPPVGELTHYYELEIFPRDSQNQPVVCCAARLPEGFPTGDQIREPVQVAGIFFKRWLYVRRPAAAPDRSPPLPERLASPLLLAAQPLRLPRASADAQRGGLWGGAALLAALAAAGAVLARIAWRDRLARTQRARYHAPLDDLTRLP